MYVHVTKLNARHKLYRVSISFFLFSTENSDMVLSYLSQRFYKTSYTKYENMFIIFIYYVSAYYYIIFYVF